MKALDQSREDWVARWPLRGLADRQLVGSALARARERLDNGRRGGRRADSVSDVERALWTATRELGKTLNEPQSVSRVRLTIMDALREKANVDVLLMTPPTPFLGVSGALTQLIDYIGRVDSDFCKYFRRASPWPRTFDDFLAEGLEKHHRLSALATFFIDVRNTVEGIDPSLERDWLLPFYMAMCIQSEMSYRRWVRAPAFEFDDIDFEMIEAAGRLRIDVAQPWLEFRLRSGRSWRDRVRWSASLAMPHLRDASG